MIVYIEQIVIDNMVINFFLLWFCKKLLKENTSLWRLFFGAVVGTAFAFVFPLFNFDAIIIFALKTVLCVLIILTSFPYKNLKKLATLCVTFLVSTFLLGGVVLGLVLNLFADYSMTNGTFVYTSKVPIGLFVLAGFIVFKLLYDLVLYTRNKNNLDKFSFVLKVFYLGKETIVKAFLDTGNLLVDNVTEKPVIVINFKVFKQLLNLKTEQFLLGEYEIENKRYLDLSTANQTSKMLVFEVDKVSIKIKDQEKVVNNALLGLATNNFSKSLNYDALIGLKLIEMGE